MQHRAACRWRLPTLPRTSSAAVGTAAASAAATAHSSATSASRTITHSIATGASTAGAPPNTTTPRAAPSTHLVQHDVPHKVAHRHCAALALRRGVKLLRQGRGWRNKGGLRQGARYHRMPTAVGRSPDSCHCVPKPAMAATYDALSCIMLCCKIQASTAWSAPLSRASTCGTSSTACGGRTRSASTESPPAHRAGWAGMVWGGQARFAWPSRARFRAQPLMQPATT